LYLARRPARLGLGDQPAIHIQAGIVGHHFQVRSLNTDAWDALVLQIDGPLALPVDQAVPIGSCRRSGDDGDKIDCWWDRLVLPAFQHRCAMSRTERLHERCLFLGDLQQFDGQTGKLRACIRGGHLDHPGDARTRMFLDKMPGHQAAGAVAEQDHLVVTELFDLADGFAQLGK
jgi:hypothetical protein